MLNITLYAIYCLSCSLEIIMNDLKKLLSLFACIFQITLFSSKPIDPSIDLLKKNIDAISRISSQVIPHENIHNKNILLYTRAVSESSKLILEHMTIIKNTQDITLEQSIKNLSLVDAIIAKLTEQEAYATIAWHNNPEERTKSLTFTRNLIKRYTDYQTIINGLKKTAFAIREKTELENFLDILHSTTTIQSNSSVPLNAHQEKSIREEKSTPKQSSQCLINQTAILREKAHEKRLGLRKSQAQNFHARERARKIAYQGQ